MISLPQSSQSKIMRAEVIDAGFEIRDIADY
jgi:hypothetical protein